MKIQLFSDIHNYDLSYNPKETDADIIICAGDFDQGHSAPVWAKKVEEKHKKKMFAGLGNHDYWNTSKEIHTIDEWIELYKSYNTQLVKFVEMETVVIDDVALIFATGWSDFQNDSITTKMAAKAVVKDFDKIQTESGKIQPDDIRERHLKARAFIDSELTKHSDKKCVVITHYPPSIQCNVSFNIDNLSYYWCGQMEDLIEKHKPVAWICGHMHNFFDEIIDETRVIINPAGKIKNGIAQNPDFVDGLVIEV